MNMHAARDDRDLDDAATLLDAAGLTTADQGRELLERTYPNTLLLPRHQDLPDEVAARFAAHLEDPSHPAGSTPSDEIQRYGVATRRAGQHNTVGPDDKARLTAAVETERVAQNGQTAQRGTVAATEEQEQQRRGLCP